RLLISMRKSSEFPCTRCGECCRHINRIPQLAQFDLGNGVCRYLQGNLCTIYATRPEVCRVNSMYEHYFKTHYTKEEFYQINIRACEMLKKGQFKNSFYL